MQKMRSYVAGALGGAALASLGFLAMPSAHAGAQPEPLVVKGNTVETRTKAPTEISVANCPEGTRVVGGGYTLSSKPFNAGDVGANVLVNAPTDNGTGWQIQAAWADKQQAYALCATPAS
ncbi:hypothetical protein [Streptomyces sp. NBC_00388]|uniref:hypothetical protein n=1 Tax=Streptomyces sp. NBC_00388 TaxID=2975735 RepID=UPI002E1B6E53